VETTRWGEKGNKKKGTREQSNGGKIGRRKEKTKEKMEKKGYDCMLERQKGKTRNKKKRKG
jgi:hypothetical protein